MLQRGEECGQEVHVQLVEGGVVLRLDGEEHIAAAQELQPYQPLRLQMQT